MRFCLQLSFFALVAVGRVQGNPSWITTEDCTGTCVGKLKTRFHRVTGDVYLQDDTTICIQGFYFDGQGINPDISVSSE